MKTQLLAAVAGATILATYFLLRNKQAKYNNSFQVKNNPHPPKHHLTQVFANAKKHAMN